MAAVSDDLPPKLTALSTQSLKLSVWMKHHKAALKASLWGSTIISISKRSAKYEKLAVSVEKWDKKMKKVPWKNIYFISGDYTVNGGDFSTAFTFVQTNPNATITINWNSNLNMMILTKWHIAFKWDCTSNQNVKWIFYASWNLVRTWVLHNDNLANSEWCTKWWLNIKWVLIWNGFNNLMTKSRSHLESWFGTTDKKWEIMKGGSVVIEYSPSIFTKSTMPPGAEDFTTALSIYKN